MLIRGMNSIYNQACTPQSTSDKASFIGYALAWCETVTHHHDAVIWIYDSELMTRKKSSGFQNVKRECLDPPPSTWNNITRSTTGWWNWKNTSLKPKSIRRNTMGRRLWKCWINSVHRSLPT